MRLLFKWLLVGMVCVSGSGGAEVLYSDDFEGQTVGEKPDDATIVRPSTSTVDEFVHVTGSASNTVGTGNAVEFKDNGTVNGSMLTYNFVADTTAQLSAVRIDFSFASLSATGAGDDYIAIAVGEYSASKTFNSHANRYTDMRLYNDGTVDFRGDSGTSTGHDISTGSHAVSIFVNDGLSPVDYVGLDSSTNTLAANSVAYWLDGSMLLFSGAEYTAMDLDDVTTGGTVGTSENNLGKFGFNTTTSDVGLDYLIDDIEISSLESGSGNPDPDPAPDGLSEILSEDFETQLVGAKPTGATTVRPSTNTELGYTLVVSGTTNSAGEGNGARLHDFNSADGNMLTYNFVALAADQLSAVRVDFSFSALSTNGAGDDYIAVAFGEFSTSKTLNGSARRFTSMRLYNDGTVDFRSDDSSKPYSLGNVIPAGVNTASIFVNDSDTESLSYTGIDSNAYVLAANSVAYWLNGSLVIMNGGEEFTSLDLTDVTVGGTVGTTDYNFGKFGFNTGSSDVNLDYVIDDIKIYEFVTDGPEVDAHNLFQNHMVLQRDMNAPIWGTATTGETVRVFLDGVEIGSTVADTNGCWMIQMPAHAADGGVAHSLKVSVDGAKDIIFSDVLFGDVYLCSGQSNMAFAMASITNYDAISSTLTNALIRHVNVDLAYSETLLNEPGSYKYPWERGDDLNDVRHFTAIGYLTALELQKEIGVPIGLLHSSYGGMEINMFLNPEGLELVPGLSGLAADLAQGGSTDLYDVYNAMIGPLVPYGICGMLWYQGESDRDKPAIYEEKMRGLIRGWRAAWNLGDLPFYYVQLPNFNGYDEDYPYIREPQLNVLSEPYCGMVVTIDVGDDADIHPTNKQDPSYRLAQVVLEGNYDQDRVFSGPLVYEAQVEGDSIRVLFDYVEGGLMIGQKTGLDSVVEVSGPLQNFEIAGADRVFVAATAEIDADTVVVSAPSVAAPYYVRYCYIGAPTGLNKLYNTDGFPASPFRTDKSSELKVIGGSGSQEFVVPGTVIAVVADAPASGKVFDRWIGGADVVADVNSSSTTITMPEHGVYLVASYRDSATSAYTLTVTNGLGSSTAQAGAMVMIQATAAPTGQVFLAWTGDTAALVDASAESTTVIMPAEDVFLTAIYTTEPVVPPADTKISEFSVAADGGVDFVFPNDGGYRYKVDSSTNLVEGIWQTEIYNIQGTGDEHLVALPGDGAPEKFYKVSTK